MGQRLRALTLLVVLLGAGTLLGSGLAQWWQGTTDVPDAPAPRPEGRVRVEVLNGGGIQGIARSATRALRDSGFDVVYYGNAETFTREGSVVLDRVGRPKLAEGVAEALGIREVRTQLDSTLYLEVTVYLGSEWPSGDPWGEPMADSVALWWESQRNPQEAEGSRRDDDDGR